MLISIPPNSDSSHTAALVPLVAIIAIGAYVFSSWSPWAELADSTFIANPIYPSAIISYPTESTRYPVVLSARPTRHDASDATRAIDSSATDSNVPNASILADSGTTHMPTGLK